MRRVWVALWGAALGLVTGCTARAQEPAVPAGGERIALTLQRSIELAMQNSRDVQVAKIQASLADKAAFVSKAEFLPNLSAGSGAGYSNGIPETPGGRAPSLFSVTYNEKVLNEPLRGQAKELQEQVRSQQLVLADVKNAVMARTAAAYLELAKVRHALELLRKEEGSAARIVDLTQQREKEGFELPVEVTKAQLTRAQVAQRILQLEGREDELEVFLRNQLGLAAHQEFDVAAEELPGEAEQEGANLIAMALQNNTALKLAESDVRAKEFRLKGEKRGYWPTLEFVSVYSVLARFNNFDEFFNRFQRNNFNAGVQVQIPIFSARAKAAVGLAQVNLQVAKASLENKKSEVSAEVRQKSRKVKETEAAKEVARLELQLVQQNLSVAQAQFDEGRTSVRDMEKLRLDESEKWMAFLDANFKRQQAQIELLRAAGQLDKLLQ